MLTRRNLGATLAAAAAAAAAGPSPAQAPPAAPGPPDLSFLRSQSLVNDDRLRFFMREAGLDAIVVARPANVFYLSGHWPQLDRMGFDGSAVAVYSADPKRPLALVMHAFLYYYTHSPETEFTDRLVFTYTQPASSAAASPEAGGREPPASPARTMAVADEALLTGRDRHRTRMLGLAQPPSADASWALRKAMVALGLDGKRVGIDHPALEPALKARGFAGSVAGGEDALRWARLVKSPVERRLMRLAAQNNVEAAMAAASRARTLGGSRRLRAAFYAEAAQRGNLGSFMVISGASTEVLDEELADGSSISIDCVSTCRGYHGDFGRTIFIGEPRPVVQRAARGIAVAWDEIRAQLRPGMKFADVPRIGRESLKRQGLDLNVSFNPHSVGLFHTDHPQPSLLAARGPESLTLEENMILSVDCPLFLAGAGGTVHLEDLSLIRADGAEPIHTVPPPVIVV